VEPGQESPRATFPDLDRIQIRMVAWMQAVPRDIARRQGQATCSLEEKTVLPSPDIFVHERSEVRMQLDVPNACICFGIWLDLVTLLAALLTDVDYRATSRERGNLPEARFCELCTKGLARRKPLPVLSSLRLARGDFSSSQDPLVEFGAIEAASLRKDAPWTDEHS
jgi:hypothetical protein